MSCRRMSDSEDDDNLFEPETPNDGKSSTRDGDSVWLENAARDSAIFIPGRLLGTSDSFCVKSFSDIPRGQRTKDRQAFVDQNSTEVSSSSHGDGCHGNSDHGDSNHSDGDHGSGSHGKGNYIDGSHGDGTHGNGNHGESNYGDESGADSEAFEEEHSSEVSPHSAPFVRDKHHRRRQNLRRPVTDNTSE